MPLVTTRYNNTFQQGIYFFGKIVVIYPTKPEIKKNDRNRRNYFNFAIIKFPHFVNNIPTASAYGVNISQHIWVTTRYNNTFQQGIYFFGKIVETSDQTILKKKLIRLVLMILWRCNTSSADDTVTL
jgi:hypothetical protein